jgi:hypothetical protein
MTRTNRLLRREIRAAIRKLPDHPSKIADRFRRRGFKGELVSPFHCPMTNYLRHEIGDLLSADHVLSTATGAVRLRECGDIIFEMQLPRPVTEFIRRFDTVKYEALIAKFRPISRHG